MDQILINLKLEFGESKTILLETHKVLGRVFLLACCLLAWGVTDKISGQTIELYDGSIRLLASVVKLGPCTTPSSLKYMRDCGLVPGSCKFQNKSVYA